MSERLTSEQRRQVEEMLSFYSDGWSLVRYFQFRVFGSHSKTNEPCGICSESARGNDICHRCVATFAPLTGAIPPALTRLVCGRLDEVGDKHRADLLRRLCPNELPESYVLKARQKLGLTQAELARRIGVGRGAIVRAEADPSRGLGKLADARLSRLLRKCSGGATALPGREHLPSQTPCFTGSAEAVSASLGPSSEGVA